MAILLVAATAFELEKFVDTSSAAGTDCEILVTGVGSVVTCYKLLEKVSNNPYELIIQAGIAGSFTDDLKPGEVVAVKKDCFGDLGMEEQDVFVPVFNTSLADADEFPYDKGWLVNSAVAALTSLRTVTAVTINKVTDNLLQRKQLLNHFNPEIESMEGAAFEYVMLQKNIPHLQLRAISNKVGDRNKSNWHIDDALSNLAEELVKIVSNYNFRK